MTYATCGHVPDHGDVVTITANDGTVLTGVVIAIYPSILVLGIEGEPDLYAPAYRTVHQHEV